MIAPLEQQSLGRRIAFTFIIVIILLLVLAFIGWSTGGWNTGPEAYGLMSAEEPLTASKYDARIIELDRQAADNAYREHIEKLFAVWMRDDTGQPARAAAGAHHGRKAYIDVQKAIDKREKELQKLRELSPQN